MHCKNNFSLSLCAAAMLFAGAGCGASGSKLHKMTGKVTLEGQPVEGAIVHYEPVVDDPTKSTGVHSAEGITGADGVYSLTTNTTNDGVAEGKYKVTITKTSKSSTDIQAPPAGTDMAKFYQEQMAKKMMNLKTEGGKRDVKAEESRLPLEYSDPQRTPWMVTVPTPDGKFDIPMKKSGGA
jgi:hypothetical protein